MSYMEPAKRINIIEYNMDSEYLEIVMCTLNFMPFCVQTVDKANESLLINRSVRPTIDVLGARGQRLMLF